MWAKYYFKACIQLLKWHAAQGWKWKGSKWYWIQKQIWHFHVHLSMLKCTCRLEMYKESRKKFPWAFNKKGTGLISLPLHGCHFILWHQINTFNHQVNQLMPRCDRHGNRRRIWKPQNNISLSLQKQSMPKQLM